MSNISKRITALCLLLLCVFSAASALSVRSFLEEAKMTSPDVRSYERTKENVLLLKAQGNLKGVSITAQSGAVIDEDSVSIGYPSLPGTSSVSITSPEIGDGFYINGSLSMSSVKVSDFAGMALTPSVSLSKDFKLRSFSDTRSDIEDEITTGQAEYTYDSNMLNFSTSFYQSIIEIMNASLNLNKTERTYLKNLNDYEKKISAGFIREDSLISLQNEMNLESAKASYESARTRLESLLSDFRDKYGLEYREVTSVPEAVLEINDNPSLSSGVRLASLNLESAKQDLLEQQGYSASLTASASASDNLVFDKDFKNTSSVLDVSLKASYTDKNWTASAAVSGTTDFDSAFSPKLTIAGKWTNSTTRNESDRITEKRLANAVLEKQAAYDNALAKYSATVSSLKNSVNEYRSSLSQFKIKEDYHKRSLEMVQKLFDSSLASQDDLDDALFELECDRISSLVLALQGLVLENNIRLLNL